MTVLETMYRQFDINDIKMVLRIQTALCKLFDKSPNELSRNEILAEKRIVVCDKSFVCAIEALNPEARLILKPFYNKVADLPPLDNLEYTEKLAGREIRSRYSFDYFNRIIAVLKAAKIPTLDIKINVDFPITIETELFRFVLAPRIIDE